MNQTATRGSLCRLGCQVQSPGALGLGVGAHVLRTHPKVAGHAAASRPGVVGPIECHLTVGSHIYSIYNHTHTYIYIYLLSNHGVVEKPCA